MVYFSDMIVPLFYFVFKENSDLSLLVDGRIIYRKINRGTSKWFEYDHCAKIN